ncbi:cytidylyltransferase domain-containing protein [Aquimarina celericrescens]|uniref:Cytidylyltransferase domain-containing protein n=1 Tax=Aquimarina celericrescens TaxID=1964542 RepID=A0ABW5ATJ8_9FLAO|nr:hypothetical protein [Aquimarina celericrescens]
MTGIIILCRYNSSRLPGKILKTINEKPILDYILERLERLKNDFPIIVCTSIEKTDDPIVEFCQKNNIKHYRGSLDNVAARFLKCARTFGLSHAVRINGDNLFLDVDLIQSMISMLEEKELHFISNVEKRTFPRGMSVEIVNVDYYENSFSDFDDSDLEHVMTYFYRNKSERMKFVYNESKNNLAKLNLAIDTQEDFENAKQIIAHMDKDHRLYNYNEVINLHRKIRNE